MSRKVCQNYLNGACKWGKNCKFSHDVDSGRSARHHPYAQAGGQGNARQSGDGGGHGPQRRAAGGHQQQQHPQQHQQQRQQQHHSSARGSMQPGGSSSRQQQLLRKSSGAVTPLSPAEAYPAPPPEDAPQQQQQQQQPQQPQQPRPQQQQSLTALARARAMCKLLGIGNAAPLVTPEAEAAAVKFFAAGAFFKETPFGDSIEKFLPLPKQQ